ncbi:hypothetical protein EYF80_011153 [Liparis tanakae]|uniref:Secreted protein n=1 Tax=Liparis tanakae TaxID=230148 RepID=A0A4Z2ILF7_9TELE|nr:hypothetical protein EYF80_011153 [Liparis tanakae]
MERLASALAHGAQTVLVALIAGCQLLGTKPPLSEDHSESCSKQNKTLSPTTRERFDIFGTIECCRDEPCLVWNGNRK